MRSETSKVTEIHGMIPFLKMTDFERLAPRVTGFPGKGVTVLKNLS
jgi:hypothetical protein